MTVRLNPYLNFPGTAREALDFYHGVLGGELVTTTFAVGGMPHDPADAEKLMHGQLDAENGMTLMAADIPTGWPTSGPIQGMSISLSGEDGESLTRYWNGLAEGATIDQPLVAAPWGDTFGMLTDRFGVSWMVNITAAKAG
jgi:PhnB protein